MLLQMLHFRVRMRSCDYDCPIVQRSAVLGDTARLKPLRNCNHQFAGMSDSGFFQDIGFRCIAHDNHKTISLGLPSNILLVFNDDDRAACIAGTGSNKLPHGSIPHQYQMIAPICFPRRSSIRERVRDQGKDRNVPECVRCQYRRSSGHFDQLGARPSEAFRGGQGLARIAREAAVTYGGSLPGTPAKISMDNRWTRSEYNDDRGNVGRNWAYIGCRHRKDARNISEKFESNHAVGFSVNWNKGSHRFAPCFSFLN